MACSSNAALQIQAFQLFDLQCLGLSIGRADADEDSVFGAQPFQVVRARVAGVDLHSQHIQIPPRHYLNVGNEAWTDRIGDQVCEFLFRRQHVGHAADVLRPVLHTDDDDTAGSVRERNQAFQNALRG